MERSHQRDQRGAVTRHMAQQLQQLQQQHQPQQTAPLAPPSKRHDAQPGTTNSTAFFSSALCEDGHRVPSHPESWERVQVVRERIEKQFPTIRHVRCITPATRQRLLLFHTPKHVDKMTRLFDKSRVSESDSDGASVAENDETEHQGQEGGREEQTKTKTEQLHQIDEDTAVTRGSEGAALAAAGAVCDAIDLVMRGDSKESSTIGKPANATIKNAFCGVRPPGHHAEPQRAMGFCLFNNVGVGACYLLDAYPDEVKRVTVLDFDVHHGNGTQAKFIESAFPNVQYLSTHQAPFYPNTGKPSERGATDNVVNIPLPARTGSSAFREVFTARVLPAMDAFRPDFVLISAGFDAHAQDPLADLALESEDYFWMTQQVVALAWTHAQGRVVSVLEGGYHLDALEESAAAHVRALVEGSVAPEQRSAADEVDDLVSAFASSVIVASVAEPQELRVTVHCDGKEKLLVLKTRSLDALLAQCKNKFKSSGKKKTKKALYDCHGALLTSDLLLAMANDQHVYLR